MIYKDAAFALVTGGLSSIGAYAYSASWGSGIWRSSSMECRPSSVSISTLLLSTTTPTHRLCDSV